MWYLKVSSSLYIAVALICMIQNAISLSVDQTTEDQWSKLESSTDQYDLKKILKLCKNSINNFNEKLENTKTIVNKKLPEPNKTTEDIEKLVSDVKTQIKNSSADLVTVRKLVQKTALRFRDTFKSLASFTELDNESVNKELEGIKKTTVDSKKPLVNRVVRSFGNRYDLNKLANRVLEISADREKLKNNYDEKKKIAKKELNSLWNSLTNHSKTVNDNALKAFETFFEGMKSLKSVKKKVKSIGEDAINEIKKGDDFINLKNAVELAKALKLKFEDEWNLDSGELTYSEEQKKDTKKTMEENSVVNNEYDNSINDIEPSLPTTEQETIDNEKINAIPSNQFAIEKPSKEDSLTSDKAVSEVEETQLSTESEDKVKTTKMQPTIQDDLPDDNISDNINSPIEETSIIPNTENKKNKEKTIMVEPKDSNNETNNTDGIKSDLSNNETTFNPDITNDEKLISPNKNAEINKQNKIINKRTSREKIPNLPWQKLIQLDDPQVSQQSKKCESLLNNITADFDNIKISVKNSIQVTKNYKTLQKIENETVQRFYNKMVDTNTKLSDYLVNSAEDVCAKVTPINKRYETKFKNDPNIKRIKYLLGKQYDPNQYILKVLDDASHKTGIGGMKKTTYYKMLAVAHNLNHETKEMDDAALYAMNKIYEGKLAATNLQKMFNKEKASKACYIRQILLEKENDAEKKNKDENKEKVKESINNDTNTEPLKPDVNLDSVDDIQPSTINDDNEPILNNEEEKKTLNDNNESTTHNNLGDNENDNTTDEKENTKKENEEQTTEENYNISSIPQNRDSDSTTQMTNDEANKPKRNITRKVTHHRKHRNPNDPNDVSEEYDTIEEIDDEEDVTNEYKSSENKSNIRPEAESLFDSDNKQEVEEPEHSEKENGESNEESSSREETTKEGEPDKLKTNRRIKRIDPKDGKEISEEYEEDGNKLNQPNEKTFGDTEKSESPVTAENQEDAVEPEYLQNENVESNEENNAPADISEGDNSGESKTKRRRKRIDPKDGKEISEEYNEEEDGNKLNQPNEKTFGDTEKSESPVSAENQEDVVEPEHLQNENVESNEENNAPADISEGDNSGESKTTRRRKRIDPKDGKEISEEYNEEEDGNKLNQPNEKTFGDTEKSESPVSAENQEDAVEPEYLQNENVESNEENNASADISEGDNSGESKTKRRRKRIDPKDGKEISEEYNEEEDGNKLNQPNEKTFGDTEKSESPVIAENQEDAVEPEHLQNENVESNEENNAPADISEGDNSGESKTKRRRKRIDPKDGKEISEEYNEEEDGNKLNQPNEKTFGDTEKSESPVSAENQEDVVEPEHLQNENVESNEENNAPADISEGDNSGESKTKRRRKRIDPKDGKEISEEYNEEEDGNKLNQPNEKTFGDTEKSESPVIAENQEDAVEPEHLQNENVESNEENNAPADISEGDNSGESKTKRRRKRIDPKDGKEISEEYNEQEDGNKLNQPNEKTFGDTEKSESPVSAENQEDAVEPEHLQNENVESNEENNAPADISEGDNSGESKTKRRRKRIDPKDGKEISEEYNEEEDGNKLNQPNEKTFGDTEKSESPVSAENQEDVVEPEHLQNENVESNEENNAPADISEGDNSGESKTTRRRKRIDPKDGKEISEEYNEEEDGNKLNQPNEKTFGDTEKSESPVSAENQEDAVEPEYLQNENVESNEENNASADISEGDNSGESKTKRRRKRIDPKDGKEISEEYNEEEDGNKLNQPNEKTFGDTEKSESPFTAENQEDAVEPEHLQNENVESNEENNAPADISEGDNSDESKTKRRRKRIDPKDGKEISEEYNEEEDGNKLNQPNEKTFGDTEKSESPVSADNQEGVVVPEHLQNENVESNEENNAPADISEGDNSDESKTKRRRKRIDPKDGKEISEEYNEEEDGNKLNQPNEKTFGDTEKSESPVSADNQEGVVVPEHLQNENVESNEENNTPADLSNGDNSGESKTKRRRKRIVPKEGKDRSEENETFEEIKNDLNKSTEKKSNDTSEIESPGNANNQNTVKTPVFSENENVESNEENNSSANTSDGVNSGESLTKRRRKQKILKDGKEYSEENDTFEENDNNLNKSKEKKTTDSSEIEPTVNEENNSEQEAEEQDTNTDITSVNEDTTKENLSKEPKSFDENHKNIDQENTTNETEDLDENENLNSVEDAELKCVNNERIIPAAESMGEDSTSFESSYESPEQRQLDTSNKRPDNRRKDPKSGKNVFEEYDTPEAPEGEATLEKNKIDTPYATPENSENENNSEIPEHNQSNEHAHERFTNEVADKPSEINEQPEGVNEPNIKNKRQRRPKKNRNGLEVPEDNETDKKQNDESPAGDNDFDTPSAIREYTEDQQSSEIPEHEENPEYSESYEHEPETTTNEVVDKPSEIDEQTKGVNQPSIKKKRQKRPKKPRNGLEVPEDYETDKQNDESPTGDSENDTISETREFIEDEQSSEIPEYEEHPEYNQSNEHETETPTNGVVDKPSDVGEQDETNNQPKRRHRRRRDPKTGLEVSEEYDTLEEQDEDSPLEDNKIVTPEYDESAEYNQSNEHQPEISTNEVADKPSDIGEQDETNNQPKRRHRRRRDPKTGLEVSEEYDTLEEQDEDSPLEDNKIVTPEYDESPEYNQSNEYQPEISTNEVAEKPSEIDEQTEGVNQPSIKKRRKKRPQTPMNGLEVPEDYETDKQNDESPTGDSENDTISESREFIEDEQSSEIPEYEEHPEYNQLNEHEPEKPTNGVVDKPSDIGEQDETNNQPKRRHRRRRDPKTGLEVSEEYDTLEEQDEDSPLEDNKIVTPEYDESPEYNQSNEHQPEISTNEVADKPSDIGEQDETNNQPKRRHRRRRDPKTGLEVSEEYDTLKEQDEVSPLENNKIVTPEYDESPEYNQSNEHEPETPTNGVVDKPSDNGEQDETNNHPKRRYRRRRDPKTGLEVSEEYDTLEEQDEDSPLEDNKIVTPEYDESPEYNQSNEHQPEISTNEVADKPSDIGEQDETNNQPKRRHRRRRDPKTGLEVSEEYDTLKEQDEVSPLENNKIVTPEYDESPEYNQSNEHEPETPTNGVVDKPSDNGEQDETNNHPKRRYRRRRDPKTGLEVSEEYDTLEEQDEDSPLEDNKIVTPEYDESAEYNQSNEHQPEISTNEVADKPSDIGEQDETNNQPKRRHRRRRDPKTGLEVSEEYDTLEEQDEDTPLEDNKIVTPEYDESPEYNQSNEYQPEISTNEVAEKPSEIDEQTEGVNQPSIKKRRKKRPQTPMNGLEVPEDYETDKQNDESPTGDSENDTISESREFIKDEQSSEIPEYEEHPEYNQLNEHEPEKPTNGVVDKPSDIGEQDETNNQPKRRHRRRRDPKTGLEVSEEYDTLEEQDEDSPLEDNKIVTPEYDESPEYNQSNEHQPEISTNEVADKPSDIVEQDERTNQPNRRHRRRRDPKTGLEVSEEYDTLEEQDEDSPLEDNKIVTPEYDESPEYNQSNEHEPETPTNGVVDKPSDVGEQDETNNQPKRRHRRRRDPKTGLEVSEEYDTLEEQDEDSPLEDNKIVTPEYDESAEYNQSNEHQPEISTNEVADKPSDIGEQDETNNQPKRRHRRRRDPKTGLEVSEEYDTLEEQDEDTPLEDNKIVTPEYDESPEYNQSNEYQPEISTNEVAEKPSEIDEQTEGVNQPSIKKRRKKRPQTPRNGLEVPEDYETDKQNDESPTGDSENDTISETREFIEDEQSSEIPEYEEHPEYNQLNEHEPETPTNEVADKLSDIGEQDETNNQPKRRHRRRRDPKTGLEVSEEYDTLEEQDEDSPLEDNKIVTPEYDESPEYNQWNEHEPESSFDEVAEKPSEIDEQTEGVNQPSIKKRRKKRPQTPRNGLEVPEDYETDKQNDESPTGDSENDTISESREFIKDEQSSEIPEYEEHPEYNQLNEHEPEKPTNGVVDKPSDIGEQDETNNQPKRRHRRRRDPKTGLEVSEEYDTLEEQDEDSPLEDNKIVTPEYDESPEYNQSNEHQPEISTNEVADKPSDIVEQDETNNQPKRRHRRRRDPKTGLEVSEEYDTLEEQDEDSPLEDNKIVTPEYDESPEYNQWNEHEPESSTNEVADKPSDIVEQDERTNQPNRRHRRRGDPKSGLEVSEEYYSPEEREEESPLEDNKIDTPRHHENSEYIQSNDVENNNNQPELSEYPENSDLSYKDSATPIDTNENENVVKPRPRKIRRRRKSKQPQAAYGNDKTPIDVNDLNINNYPVENQDVNNNYIPYNNNEVLEEDAHNEYGETNDNESDKHQPELSDSHENSDLSSKDSATPIDTDDNENVVKPHPRKIRRRRKSKQPQAAYGNNKTPIVVNDENINNYPVEDQDVNNNYIPYNNNEVLEEDPSNGNGETNDNESDKHQPELSDSHENSDLSSKDSATPIDTDDNENVVKPHPRKIRRRKKSKQPQSVNGNDKTSIETNDVSTKIIPTNVVRENSRVPNEEKSAEIPEIDPKNIQKNPKKKRHIRRIRTYVVNKATNERIPINEQTYSTTDGLPDAINNKLDSHETDDSKVDDPDSNTDNDDYSSFLFKEYNSDQCKRDAYDRFKKVTSQDAKQIAYRSVLDTSEMRSNMLATIKNAIYNVKASRTFNDVDQSLRTVSYSLKVGLKQTVSDLVIKVIPLAKDFLKTAENLKELYQRGPQSTHKMLTNILENESTVPESAKDILRLISPQFDVDELINNIFEKPCTAKSLKEKKVKAQRKLIDLSKHMDTAISNIDCFVLSAMSTVGIGADTLKLLKSGKVIMSDKHPRAKTLRDAVGIIKAGKKIRNNDDSFTPTMTSDGTTESDEDDDDEDPDQVAQKNEEFLKTVPDLDDDIAIPKKVKNKRQSLGVIVVHPDKQIEYKEVTDTSQLKKFVGDQTKKYKLQSKNKHPKFLKLNSKQLIDAMVADVKKKAERNGMTKKEMVDEIIKNLNSS